MKINKYIGILCLTLLLSTNLAAQQKKLVILHTNDMHSQVEPFSHNDRYNPGMAGMVNLKAVVDSIRSLYDHVLLLDAGDVVQGTPYYNLFSGRAEIESMSQIGYDAATIGNHEFDKGMDSLKMIYELANFPIVCCNYDMSKTPLKHVVKPYVILKKSGLKIGIMGVGTNPEGLIQKNKYTEMVFLPVVETANKYAEILKVKKKCDIVICLTHIGYRNDLNLAAKSRNIDFFIGGHSHTFMQNADFVLNADGKTVTVSQCGKGAAFVGMYEILIHK